MRSWREVCRRGKSNALTPEARRRKLTMLARNIGIASATISIMALGGLLYYLHTTQPATVKISGSGQPLRQLYFDTDGVLDQTWLQETLKLPKNAGLLDIDIYELDEKLEADSQVRAATVRRSFPDGLVVNVNEYQPVMRVMVRDPEGTLSAMLVADNGEVYTGKGYAAETLKRLPYVAGVQLHEVEGEISPIDGVPVVAELLQAARIMVPSLYADWRVVKLDRFDDRVAAPWSVIIVQTRSHGEILFAPKNFEEQLMQLDNIIASMREQGYTNISRIDLSLDDQAAVKLASSAPIGNNYRR